MKGLQIYLNSLIILHVAALTRKVEGNIFELTFPENINPS